MNQIKLKNKALIALSVLVFIAFISCEENRFNDIDENFVSDLVIPKADFNFTIEERVVTFTNNSSNADTFTWNFDSDNAIESFARDTVFTFSNSVETTTIVLNARNTASNVTNIATKELTFVKADFEIVDLVDKTITFQSNSSAAESYLWE